MEPGTNNFDLSTAQPLESVQNERHVSPRFLLLFFFLLVLIFGGVFLYFKRDAVFQLFATEQQLSPISTSQKTIKSTPTPSPKKVQKKEVIGFLPSWQAAAEVKVVPSRLTQVIYSGIAINKNGELVKRTSDGTETLEWTYLNSTYFSDIRKEASASGTKVLVSIKNFDNENIDTLISNPTATTKSISELKQLIADYRLDGINLNFEYFTDIDFPTLRFLNQYLETLSQELKKTYPKLILSFDVNATAVFRDNAYDMVKIGETMDQVILMGYDYNRPQSTRAGPVAPINGDANEHSIRESLNSMKGRVPPEKVILGLPFYGYEWQTTSVEHKSQTIPETGALASYKRVRELLDNREDVTTNWDEVAQSPWIVYRQNGFIKQIYYENERSLEEKIKLVHEEKLDGIAIWALGYEGDYEGMWIVINSKLNQVQ